MIATVLVVSIRGDQAVNEVKLQNELTNLANQYSAKTVLLDGTRRRSAMGGYSFIGYIAPDTWNNIFADSSCIPSSCGWLIKQLLSWNFLSLVPIVRLPVGANWGNSDGAVGRRTKRQSDPFLAKLNRQRHRGGTHFPAGD